MPLMHGGGIKLIMSHSQLLQLTTMTTPFFPFLRVKDHKNCCLSDLTTTHPARLHSSSPLHLNILKLTLSIHIHTTDASHMYVKKYPLPEVIEVPIQHYSYSVGGNILLVPL